MKKHFSTQHSAISQRALLSVMDVRCLHFSF